MKIRRVIAFFAVFAPLASFAVVGGSGCEYISNVGYYSLANDGGGGDAACDGGIGCGRTVVEMAGGYESACAVLSDGTVWCWGGNQYGTVGVGHDGDEVCLFDGKPVACRPQPTQVPGLRDVVHVSGGKQFTCALERDGSVWCWGRNDDGVVDRANQPDHAGLLGHPPGTAGDSLCADYLDGGPGAIPCNSTPQKVDGLSAVEIAAGQFHSCAVEPDGGLACWGSNRFGGLGDRSVDGGSPTPHGVPDIPPMSHVSISLNAQSCSIEADGGGVWCWGPNNNGQLGHPSDQDKDDPQGGQPKASYVPLPVITRTVVGTDPDGGAQTVDIPFKNVVSVKPAYLFTCALVGAGEGKNQVWCWGSDSFATMGPPTTGHPLDDQFSPRAITQLGVVTSFDTRFAQVCARISNGDVFCWGSNVLGELGIGNLSASEPCPYSLANSPTVLSPCWRQPVRTINVSNAVSVATGTGIGFALGQDRRTIWAWGDNDTARLGHVPQTAGDFVNCGDTQKSVCNVAPQAIPGFPP